MGKKIIYILIILTIIGLIFYFKGCNKDVKQPELNKISPNTWVTKSIEVKQKEDVKIKMVIKKTIKKKLIKEGNNWVDNIGDTILTQINDSEINLRVDNIDTFSFDLTDDNVKVIVSDTTSQITTLDVRKRQENWYNKHKFGIGMGIGIGVITILIIFI